MMKRTLTTTTLLAAVLAGCAGSAPTELVRARTAYQEASQGPAASMAPADLHSAKETLAVAERSFDQNGDSDETKDLAYAAQRSAEYAAVKGRTAATLKARKDALAQEEAMRDARAKATSAQLAQTKQALASQAQELENERQRREDAEKRAASANDALGKIASVKNESRGMVITLSGSVLFASNKSELLGPARTKLDQVAQVLSQQDGESAIRVEGYTDSTGTAAVNERLSQARADSVRSYLVSRGIAADRVTAVGLGPQNPVADNGSAEGRANNRRVEIVIQPPSAPAGR